MPVDPNTKAGKIVAYHLAHPEQTRPQIAAALDIKEDAVRTVVARYRLAVPSLHLARLRDGTNKPKPLRRQSYAGQVAGSLEWGRGR